MDVPKENYTICTSIATYSMCLSLNIYIYILIYIINHESENSKYFLIVSKVKEVISLLNMVQRL